MHRRIQIDGTGLITGARRWPFPTFESHRTGDVRRRVIWLRPSRKEGVLHAEQAMIALVIRSEAWCCYGHWNELRLVDKVLPSCTIVADRLRRRS
jgi:hypothetical protein